MHHAEVNHDYADNLHRNAPKETINQDLDKEVA
jgi:hypothetical protein